MLRQPRVSFLTLYYVAAADRLPCLSRASRGASKGGGRPSRGTAISGCAPLSVGLEPREGPAVRLLLRPWEVGASSSPEFSKGSHVMTSAQWASACPEATKGP